MGWGETVKLLDCFQPTHNFRGQVITKTRERGIMVIILALEKSVRIEKHSHEIKIIDFQFIP